MRIAFLLGVFALVLGVSPTRAQDYQDGQLWSQTVVTSQVSANWRTHVELQPRMFDNGRELGFTIIRTAVGRQLTPRLTVWGGYTWVARSLGPSTRWERRSWQQASISLPRAGSWTPSMRLRIEQRWLEPWANVTHRVRLMARVQRPVRANSPWHIAFYDEAMFTLDTTTPGPYRGYDRNRLFSGLGRRVSPALTVEGGYLWENSTIYGPGQRNEHVALLTLNVAWPRR